MNQNMGLHIHSVAEFPVDARRKYYIYLLDYGWDEPLSNVLRDNFAKLADAASRNNAVVLAGTPSSHFADEVFSYHHINGVPGSEILPAVLITTEHPQTFRERFGGPDTRSHTRPMLLVPLRNRCETPSDVATVLQQIIEDFGRGEDLANFRIARELTSGKGAIADAIVLEPNFMGVGLDIKALVKFLRRRAS